MAQEFRAGQIVPESGIYRITHDVQHAADEHEITVIKGRRFPTCRHCQGVSFELMHAAKHAQEFRPGQIVPESGIYRISHDVQHAADEHEITVIKGRRFPTCRHCQGASFELMHAAKHASEMPHMREEGEAAYV